MFQISVLGPVEVRRDGELIPVPGGKTSELMVRLALDAGTPVRADRLLEDLWGDDAVDTRLNTLQSKVTRLRRALADPTLVVSGDGGYLMDITPDAVDALVVLQEAATAAQLLGDGDVTGAAAVASAALARFHGDLLPSAGDGDWVGPHRTRLAEARVSLLETQLSARLRRGDPDDVVADLESAVAEAPYRETLWELLITALYRAGRQADALAAHERVRAQLAEDLGLEPGPRLQQLQQSILTHDDSLAVPAAPTPLHGRPTPADNLPSMSAGLVGRHDEVAGVSDLLAAHRLVEIVGPGGMGKTTLAVAVGRELIAARRPDSTDPNGSTGSTVGADGVWLARLETAVSVNDVVDTVIATLSVTGGEAALVERVRAAEGLLILDNCEHVLDAAAALAVRLLDAAPRLRILATSQVPLDIEGERILELAPLDLDHAVELFTERARAQRTSASSGDHDAIAELCRSLDGLPLAIELAAARTRTLSVEQITRRLDDRFVLLADPSSRKPERRRALKATIGWSYELLFPDDQRGLWALATFAGGATLDAVEHVLGALDVPPSAAIDVVGRLAGRSLVRVDDEPESTSVRYRLLDSIRAFALDAMADAGLSDRALAAHAAWFAEAARTSTDGVRSRHQAEHLALARTERANIDAALAWSAGHDPGVALDIAHGFGWAWVVLGDSRGAQRALAALEAAGDDAPPAQRAAVLLLAAWIEASIDHLELAGHHIDAAVETAEAIGDPDLQARCHYYRAYVVSHLGEFERAMELTAAARAIYDQLDRPWDQAANALFASRAAISAADVAASVAARDQVQRWVDAVDDPWLDVRRQAMLGELARLQHRFDDAVEHIGRAAATSRRLGFLQTEAYQVSSLGRAQCQAGDYEAGAATLALAVEKAEAIGDLRMAALARVHLGRVLRALDRTEAARATLEAAAEWHQGAGGGEQAALGDCLLAAVDAAEGRAGADARLIAIVETAGRNGDAHVEVFALDALARMAARAGDLATAAGRLARADAAMAEVANFITDRDRTDAAAVRSIVNSTV